MRKLYQINEDLENIIEQARIEAEENDGIVSDELFQAIEELGIEREQKIEGVALHVKSIDAYLDSIKKEEDRLKKLKLAASKERDGMKLFLSNALMGEKFSTTKCNIAFRRSVATIIEDENALPTKFIEVKFTSSPDKAAIKKAINAGEEVAGAYLQENKNISIK